MLLTKALEQQLRHYLSSYYYDDYAEEGDPAEQVRKEVDRLLDDLHLEFCIFCELERSLSDACAAYERQGFLRGYEHCLKMLNLLELRNGGSTIR